MIYGYLEDNTSLALVSYFQTKYEAPFEIIFYQFYFLIASKFDSIKVLNLFIISLFLINFFVSFKLFKYFLDSRLISILLSFVVLVSPFSLYHSQNHLGLLNIWIVPLFIYLIFECFSNENYHNNRFFLKGGLYLAVTVNVSVYLGFFGLLLALIFFIIYLGKIFYEKKANLIFIRDYFFRAFLFFVPSILSLLILNLNLLMQIPKIDKTSDVSFLSRPIEDFFIFSSRPWYYFLPSVDNPLFGNFSRSVINYLENDWGNYLAQNYFKSEHSSSFLGITNFVLAILGISYIIKNKLKIKNYINLYLLGASALFLILFTMPPYVDFNSFRFYFPSYLVSTYLPMFRVLSRIGIYVLYLQLVFTGFGYLYIYEKFKNWNIKLIYSYFLLFILFSISVVEFYIPIKLTDISEIPAVYKYIKTNIPEESKIIFMPRNKSNEVLFWSKDFQREVISLERNHKIYNNLVSKDEFINKYLYTCDGLKLIKEYGSNYFVYFFNSDINSELKLKFLNEMLIKDSEFLFTNQDLEYKNFFYNIKYTGNNQSNHAIIFKIPEIINCN
jgi:hypothetical protein